MRKSMGETIEKYYRNYFQKISQIYHIVLSMLLSLALSIEINYYFDLNLQVGILVLISLISAVTIYIIDKNKKILITYLILATCLLITGIVLHFNEVNLLEWTRGFINWTKTYDGSPHLYIMSYALAITIIINILGNFVFYNIKKKQITRILLGVFNFVVLIIFAILQIDLSKLIVGIVIFDCLNILIEISLTRYKNEQDSKGLMQDSNKHRQGIMYLIPVCLLLTFIVILFPSKTEPIQWNAIKNVSQNIKDRFEMIQTNVEFFLSRSNDEFSVSFTGYSDDDTWLGRRNLIEDDRIALIINKQSRDRGQYVLGSFRDIYTGSGWKKNKEITSYGKSEYLLDYAELIYALSRQDQEVLEEELFIKPSYMTINYNYIKTSSFFYTTKATTFRLPNNMMEPNMEFANVTFPKPVSKDISYRVNFLDMNLNGQAFQEMLREANSFSYKRDKVFDNSNLEWIEDNLINTNQAPILSNDNLSEYLSQRASDNRQYYLQLPDKLPDRVRDLAFEITKEYDNSYDKLRAIEGYLRTLSYTTRPEASPDKRDYVDFFLFDSREGYCTSFATAMCVLARCLDIPTRYAQGYILDGSSTDEKGTYLVKNNQAHAWAEAYIEGVGWIPFEATPANYETRYTQWKEDKPKDRGENSDKDDYTDRYEFDEEIEIIEIEDEIEEQEKNLVIKIINAILIGFVALIILLVFLIGYYNYLKLRYKKRLEKADLNEKMYLTFINILWRLEKEGYKLSHTETILEFADRIAKDYILQEISFLDIAKIFMKHRYGKIDITDEDYQKLESYNESFRFMQKEKWRKSKYLLDEFKFYQR